VRENTSSGEGQGAREKQTPPMLSGEPDAGLDPRTLDHDLS